MKMERLLAAAATLTAVALGLVPGARAREGHPSSSLRNDLRAKMDAAHR